MGFSSILILAFSSILLITEAQQKFAEQDIYNGCGQVNKICFGDEENCILNKNCTFVVTAIDEGGKYKAEIQNNCDTATNNVFFGVGVHALYKEITQSGATAKYTCAPKFQDFKFIILWDGVKCPVRKVVEKKWANMDKQSVPECKSSPSVSDLLSFTQQNMLVQSGNIPMQLIKNNEFAIKNGIFYTNKGPESMNANKGESKSGGSQTNIFSFALIPSIIVSFLSMRFL